MYESLIACHVCMYVRYVYIYLTYMCFHRLCLTYTARFLKKCTTTTTCGSPLQVCSTQVLVGRCVAQHQNTNNTVFLQLE